MILNQIPSPKSCEGSTVYSIQKYEIYESHSNWSGFFVDNVQYGDDIYVDEKGIIQVTSPTTTGKKAAPLNKYVIGVASSDPYSGTGNRVCVYTNNKANNQGNIQYYGKGYAVSTTLIGYGITNDQSIYADGIYCNDGFTRMNYISV